MEVVEYIILWTKTTEVIQRSIEKEVTAERPYI
ncbi:hypothetical protein SAMN05443529_12520 [Desulfosporosinus hippei DSM 8344]|uniref:Uncharacterized protein n=1 Tax=Desulfosporosinus hippei DSM 8344 TaxID=1121419 RepID=A0A1G8HE70_9FIRM|nr:hypothetical protein SAMN05443529_12520 [Desulfosporosinus hippei DSM 8344]